MLFNYIDQRNNCLNTTPLKHEIGCVKSEVLTRWSGVAESVRTLNAFTFLE
jgi:hypothetical protein